MTNEIGLMVISGIHDCPTSITPGREEEGMGYYGGGVTMGKCFYCMLLAPPPRLPSSPTTEERYLSPPFRASRSKMLEGAYPSPKLG